MNPQSGDLYNGRLQHRQTLVVPVVHIHCQSVFIINEHHSDYTMKNVVL
jgi:hypothetical protein